MITKYGSVGLKNFLGVGGEVEDTQGDGQGETKDVGLRCLC